MDYSWSIWLEPSELSQNQLSDIIKKLSKKFSFPSFAPHITLFGRVDNQYESTRLFLENIVGLYKPFILSITGIEQGPYPWKSFYLKIKKNDSLNLLQSKIDKYLNHYRDYEFMPHISLAYGELDISETELDDFSFPKLFYFDSISIVEMKGDTKSWEKSISFNLGE